jgi:hypothetical protein
MLVVIRKPAREKQPVRAALHLISRQHEKAFKEPRVSLTVISSSTLLKPDRSHPFSNIIQKEKRSRKQSCLAPKHISTSATPNATQKIQKNRNMPRGTSQSINTCFCILTDPPASWKKMCKVQVQRRTTICHQQRHAAMTLENVYSLADSSSELPEGYLSGSHKVLNSAATSKR